MDEPGLDDRRAGPWFASASRGLMADLWRSDPLCWSILRFRRAQNSGRRSQIGDIAAPVEREDIVVIYGEYIEHDRTLPIEIFQHIGHQSGWVSDVDVKVGNLGRAERIAPEPSVICLWRHPGMARMDEWEASFRTDESRRSPAFQATRLAIHFRRGALYDEIIGGPPLGEGLHYVEFFAAGEDISDEQTRDNFSKRAKQYPAGKLDFVLRRVGLLGPDPGGIAIWTFADYAAAEPIVRERHGGNPLRPLQAGLYYNFEDALI
jgi:hypothetical protein